MIFVSLIFFISNLCLFYFHDNLNKINYPVDHPNKRKIHSKKILLSGGLFFFINLVLFILINLLGNIELIIFSKNYTENFFLFSTITFFLLGFVDDKANLNPNLKLLIIILILSFFLYLNKYFIIEFLSFSFMDDAIYLGKYSYLFTILCLSLFINAFNMYDGINLQSGSYSLLFFIFFILNSHNIFFSIVFVFSHILFMIKNFKSKSFLGDNGCYILSFIIGIFIIDLYKNEKIYCDQIFLLMMFPGIDMLRLFVVRLFKKQNPFVGDKNHIHHILLENFNQNKVFIILFFINLLIFITVLFKLNTILIFMLSLTMYFLLQTKKLVKF